MIRMMKLKTVVAATVCCAFLSVCLIGCGSNDMKQDPASGGKGLTTEEKKAKKGDE